MFCFVDFRNRPQYKYSFPSRAKAREYLRKIENNSLGVTVIHADGRREYFENGLPARFNVKTNSFRILRGCHVKYKIRPLAVLDGIAPQAQEVKASNTANWKSRTTSPLFMLGNLKFSASLLMVSIAVFSFSYLFQKNMGQSAAAEEVGGNSVGVVLGTTDDKSDISLNAADDNIDTAFQIADEAVIMNLIGKIDSAKEEDFRSEIIQYVKNRPMEDMAPYIAKQPRIVAAFLVGIAMKESKFGTYSPQLDGRDCHNYWGFKGGGTTTSGGYTCFSSPEQAIEIVGRRIAKLVDGGRTNPSEMIVWKCGATCSWDNPENVRSWIADVGINFYRINSAKETT
jgi:hypothetical protein